MILHLFTTLDNIFALPYGLQRTHSPGQSNIVTPKLDDFENCRLLF